MGAVTSTKSAAAPSRNFVPFILAIMAMVAAADQASKAWVLHRLGHGETLYLIGDWFRLRLLFNPGAAFSLGGGSTWLFSAIQLAFVIGVLVGASKVPTRWYALGFALIGGGALGNLIDRLFRAPSFFLGHVVDFISVGSFAVFNLADSAITCGVVAVIIASWTKEGSDAQRAASKEQRAVAAENEVPRG